MSERCKHGIDGDEDICGDCIVEERSAESTRIAELEAALAEKERELAEMREAIRSVDLYGSEFCPWCREEMRWINFGGKQHKPDCIYARLKVGEASGEEK